MDVALRTEHVLWLVGLLLLAVAGTAAVEERLYQSTQARLFDDAVAAGSRVGSPGSDTRPGFAPGLDPGVLGRLEVPRLDLSVMVREGVDAATLKVAVGHIPGTALPGRPGNVALAGHRDTLFRKLAEIRRGDFVKLTTLGGTQAFRVDSVVVVKPDRVDFLASDPRYPALTLLTCYPFDWVGPAPERFLVIAHPLS